METYICRKCGAALTPQEDGETAVCDFCGSVVRLPSVDPNVFNRAVRLRMDKEFDKAAVLFRQCVSDAPRDAESHWNLLLCKFGILYVEDKNGVRVPTCSGITYNPITEDEDYLDAVRFSDELNARMYEEEARKIQMIQQEIIRLSNDAEKYDIFISYKETDENGGRTESSVIAQELYDALSSKGYRVFFSRVSLKGQAGMKYEPIIFSALSSAVVMLLVGTSPEQLEAVWVSNEWQRFLYLMEKDKDKKLEVIYKGMKRVDLPAKLRFMPQRDITDAGKYGWQQDVVYDVASMPGIQKKNEKSEPVTLIPQTSEQLREGKIKDFYERADRCLSQGNRGSALKYLDQALDVDGQRVETWFRMLQAASKYLGDANGSAPNPPEETMEYAKNVLKLASPEDTEFVDSVNTYLESWKFAYGEKCYKKMSSAMKSPDNYSEEHIRTVKQQFELVQQYADAELAKKASEENQKWEQGLAKYRQYHELASNEVALFQTLSQNDPELNKPVTTIKDANRKLKQKTKHPFIGFSVIPAYLVFALAPYLLTRWTPEQSSAPWRGWLSIASVILFVLYIAVQFLVIYGLKDKEGEWLPLADLVTVPVLGFFYLIAGIFNTQVYRLFGLFYGISIPKRGAENRGPAIDELLVAIQPFMKVFLVILVVCVAWAFVYAIISHIRKISISHNRAKLKESRAAAETQTVEAFKRFAAPYVAELGRKNFDVPTDANNFLTKLVKNRYFNRFSGKRK